MCPTTRRPRSAGHPTGTAHSDQQRRCRSSKLTHIADYLRGQGFEPARFVAHILFVQFWAPLDSWSAALSRPWRKPSRERCRRNAPRPQPRRPPDDQSCSRPLRLSQSLFQQLRDIGLAQLVPALDFEDANGNRPVIGSGEQGNHRKRWNRPGSRAMSRYPLPEYNCSLERQTSEPLFSSRLNTDLPRSVEGRYQAGGIRPILDNARSGLSLISSLFPSMPRLKWRVTLHCPSAATEVSTRC